MTADAPVDRVPARAAWRALPPLAQAYVAIVIVAGGCTLAASFPRAWPPHPVLFAALVGCSILTSAWKVTLPIPMTYGATLSVSNAADLMALLLLGQRQSIVVAIAGALVQCKVHAR